MTNDDHRAHPELPAGEEGAAEPSVSAARLVRFFLLLLPVLVFGGWLVSLVHPTAGTRGEKVAELLFFVPVGIAVAAIIATERSQGRLRHPAFFGAVLGGGTPDGHANPAFRAGTLGRNESAVLQFTAMLKALSGEQWSAVLYPVRSPLQGWMADAKRSRAYRRAKQALLETDRSGEAAGALEALLRTEFQQVKGTTDLYAPSSAYAAALAILVRHAISPADFRALYGPFEPVVPPRELWSARDGLPSATPSALAAPTSAWP